MEKLNILVVTPSFGKFLVDRTVPQADENVMELIRSVSPKINVTDGSALVTLELRGDDSHQAELNAMLAETEVIFGFIPPRNITARAPKLKWFQATSAGVDRHRGTEIWNSKAIITGVSGIHATPIGEFVLGFMLMFAKNMPQAFRLKQGHNWERYMLDTIRGKTVGIVGLGHIGMEVARLSKAFGMRVIGTRRSAKQASKARNVDLLLPTSRMKEILTASDYVAVCLPLTPDTRHIIGEAEFKAMKPTARIMNIGRGNIIDEEALIKALKNKQIAGAGLDVTATEPLPKESPLWDMDNVILTPHVAGGMEDYMQRAAELFCDNLRRYLAGKKLRNIIDKKKGY